MVQRLKALLERLKWAHVVLIVGGGAAAFYFLQDNSDIEQKEASIQTERGTITNLENKIREAKEFEKQFEEKKRRYAELVKSLQNLKEALPRQFFLPDLLSDLLREAKQLEIEITHVDPAAKEEQNELYNSLAIELKAKGTFLQFFIFLDRMAHMSRLINVDKFSVEKDAQHQAVTLGGMEGAFAGTKLSGGRSVHVGISGEVRVITYRYRGSPGAGAGAGGSSGAGGKK